MPLKKLIKAAIKKGVRKKPTTKKKITAKSKTIKTIKPRSPAKRPAIRYTPGGKGKSAKANPIGQMGLRKKKVVKKQSPDDWVRTSIKFYRDEEKYGDMARAGKKLSEAQLKKYSKAIKMTTEYAAEIDGTFYNTRNHRDKMKGTVGHALDDLKDFVPKKYMDLYKKK